MIFILSSEGAHGENSHIFHLMFFPLFKLLSKLWLVHRIYLDANSNKFANKFRTPVHEEAALQVTWETCGVDSCLRCGGAGWVAAPAPAAAAAEGLQGAALTDRRQTPQAHICSACGQGSDTNTSCYLTWSFNCSVLRSVVAVNVISTCTELGTWDPFTVCIMGFWRWNKAVGGSRAEQAWMLTSKVVWEIVYLFIASGKCRFWIYVLCNPGWIPAVVRDLQCLGSHWRKLGCRSQAAETRVI